MMRHRHGDPAINGRFGSVVAACAMMTGCAAWADAEKVGPSYVFPGTYGSGDYELTHQMIVGSAASVTEVRSSLEMALSVAEKEGAKQKEVLLRFARVRKEFKDRDTGRESIFDTADPNSLKGPGGQELADMTKWTIRIRLSTDGDVLGVCGGKQFYRRAVAPKLTERERRAKAQHFNRLVAQYVSDHFAYFPRGPVAVGTNGRGRGLWLRFSPRPEMKRERTRPNVGCWRSETPRPARLP